MSIVWHKGTASCNHPGCFSVRVLEIGMDSHRKVIPSDNLCVRKGTVTANGIGDWRQQFPTTECGGKF